MTNDHTLPAEVNPGYDFFSSNDIYDYVIVWHNAGDIFHHLFKKEVPSAVILLKTI